VVELNDRSHAEAGRADRDEFLEAACKSANIPLIIIPARKAYGIQELRKNLEPFVPGMSIQRVVHGSPDKDSGEMGRDENANEAKRCPKCSSVLIKRKAKKGKYAGREFLACSSFPDCRYIEPLQ